MNINSIKKTTGFILATGLLVGCASGPKFEASALNNQNNETAKVSQLDENQRKSWSSLDLLTDTIPGMSINRAYEELIKDYEGETVIVAVVDSGIDIEHEDLKDVLWINEDEIPNNNIDDDKNGYVDDVYGWNFLGDIVEENLEKTRIVRDLQSKYEGKTAEDISAENKAEYEMYMKAKAEFDEDVQKAKQNSDYYKGLKKQVEVAQVNLTDSLKGKPLTIENLKALETSDAALSQQKMFMLNIMNNVGEDISAAIEQLDGGINYFQSQLDYHYNLDLNARAEKLGDNPDDWSTKYYGNNQVTGPDPEKADARHGTHVAGIIAASRQNDVGMSGAASNVKIMSVRAVPDGDEYDKDIALGIRYAVDNGAKVINTSFGKYFSTHTDWVNDAIKYAEENDVLIVNAAGNEGIDLDENRVYPNDEWPGQTSEIANNFINVGSITPSYSENLVSSFSNYGKDDVDVFAPGSAIYSTVPLDKYEFLQGTSMASPNVAGVAAMIRSLYPKLTAAQVKEAIMNSGLSSSIQVNVGGDPENKKAFNELSKSGKMVNMYNALIYASKL